MQTPLKFLFSIALLAWPAASFAQLNVIASGGFAAPFQEILPQFEKATGITVTTARGKSQGNGPDTIAAQLRRGAPAEATDRRRQNRRRNHR
jgi:ABC-type molybdate transport system substrate-binding protein